jgi:feruloyl esterase
MPTAWNGRFMFQGGGGTEGAVPAATGSAGTLSPTLAHGWAVASQDGGHENTQLAQKAQPLDPAEKASPVNARLPPRRSL